MKSHPTSWEDMSNYVVHFTKEESSGSAYDAIMSILYNCYLAPAHSFGIGKDKAPPQSNQQAVCFSEIPPGQWSRLEERRGTKHGLAFTKQFVIAHGGGPIWYAWKDTPHWEAIQELMTFGAGNPDDPIWRITSMIDAPGEYEGRNYMFDWEREWRHRGALSFFPDDVAFLLIPEEQHHAARSFFENVFHEDTGPAYFCPFVDPSWDRDEILEALSG
jgi:hypothetical protein